MCIVFILKISTHAKLEASVNAITTIMPLLRTLWRALCSLRTIVMRRASKGKGRSVSQRGMRREAWNIPYKRKI